MRFCQLDKVTELIPGERLRGERTLRANEDYLRDHFPFFPVMPGVLMLEALFQAGVWLVRSSDQFENSLIMLCEVKNAKFANFVEPGETLEIDVEIVKREANLTTIKASGTKSGVAAVSARLILKQVTAAESGILTASGAKFSKISVQEQWESLASGLAE